MKIGIRGHKWLFDNEVTFPGFPAEGLLPNVRMANATFEDTGRSDFDPAANTRRFVARIPEYARSGIGAVTISLQGGMPGYEGARCSAFESDGSLREGYMARVDQIICAADSVGMAVILGCFYQRQSDALSDETAVRAALKNALGWVQGRGHTNVVIDIANEYTHPGYAHRIIRSHDGMLELIALAKKEAPGLLVSSSIQGHRPMSNEVCQAADFILLHLNQIPIDKYAEHIAVRSGFGKPIVCNEDAKVGPSGAAAVRVCSANHCSWGLMVAGVNQRYPFEYRGAADDPEVYAAIRELAFG